MELRRKYYCRCCCFFSPTGTGTGTLGMTMMTCLLLLLLVNSNSTVITASSSSAATGQLHPTAAAAEEGVYDIDYRGPETHSAVFPPPGHSQIQGRPNFLHRRTTAGVAPAAAIPIASRRQPSDQHKY